ncbi:IS66-like element accessory protein TnpA [Bradyrhizobium vignae]|uniref:Transposase n=1 Tax=Bradyrhizobium vignae TaxID=1549949 RepID=A0A2U3PVI7_9BRAD|nr:transposase [Bradyrhizobium vignae]SPP93165.1 transposase [Bradyrhizobium vignae]SPP93352.1 transposase [Bradyrhizobium vignae]
MSKDSRKDSDKDRHTSILEDGADTLQRIEIITGTGRRRRWSTDAKAAIVAESFAPGASVSAVARRHDISPSLLFLWRRQATQAQVAERGDRGMLPGFVPAAIIGCGSKLPSGEQAAIEIEVGAVRIRVRGTIDRRALCEVLAAVGAIGR